jgi:hypothetical protein
VPRNHGITGQTHRECDRCGFLYPIGKLRRQKGLLVCTERRCVDNLQIERRPLQIADMLTDADGEFVDQTEQAVLSDPGELIF